jgi:hypothetical protein
LSITVEARTQAGARKVVRSRPGMLRTRGAFSLLLSLSLAALQACSEVEHCQHGQPGCLAGPPEDGRCQLDLVVTHGTCSEPGASAPPLACQCDDGEICSLDSYECLDYCAPLDVQIGSVSAPASFSCEAGESFELLCQNRCLLHCRQLQDFCASDGGCSEEACKAPATLQACQAECGTADSPVLCMAQLCGDTRALGCKNLACPDKRPADCDALVCRNACAGYNFDGVCDDGDLASAASGVCAYGSDCADCGPRSGSEPTPQPNGGACAFHSGCIGANPGNIAQAESWCIDIDPARGVSRCAPDCSDPDETCPEGSRCFVLMGVDQDGDGQPEPLAQEGRVASACFPSQCK